MNNSKSNSHEDKGQKFDDGKPITGEVLEGFSSALQAVALVGSFGAEKYGKNSWRHVENGITRYLNAEYRHKLQRATGEKYDRESGLPHAAHEAWNALARLELILSSDILHGQ